MFDLSKKRNLIFLILVICLGIPLFIQSVNAGFDPGTPPDPPDPSGITLDCEAWLYIQKDGDTKFKYWGRAAADIELWFGSTYGLYNFRKNADKWDYSAVYACQYWGASGDFEYSGVNGVGITVGYYQTFYWRIFRGGSLALEVSFTVWVHVWNGWGASCSLSIVDPNEVGHWSYISPIETTTPSVDQWDPWLSF